MSTLPSLVMVERLHRAGPVANVGDDVVVVEHGVRRRAARRRPAGRGCAVPSYRLMKYSRTWRWVPDGDREVPLHLGAVVWVPPLGVERLGRGGGREGRSPRHRELLPPRPRGVAAAVAVRARVRRRSHRQPRSGPQSGGDAGSAAGVDPVRGWSGSTPWHGEVEDVVQVAGQACRCSWAAGSCRRRAGRRRSCGASRRRCWSVSLPDPEPGRRRQEVADADAAVRAGVPGERQPLRGSSAAMPGAIDRARAGGVAAVRVVHPALVTADVDGRAGDRDGRQRVAAACTSTQVGCERRARRGRSPSARPCRTACPMLRHRRWPRSTKYEPSGEKSTSRM